MRPDRWIVALAVVSALLPLCLAQQPSLDLEQHRGKVVVVDFWASWCGPCAEAFPWLAQMHSRYAGQGLVVMSVNLDEDRAQAEAFLERHPVPFPHVFDPAGSLAEKHAVGAMPTTLVFDRDGKLVARHEGFHAEQRGVYEQRLKTLLEGGTLQIAASELPGAQAGQGIRPWQRGKLAERDMWLDCDPIDFAWDDHVYFSKEASSGGRGFGGGGCGCN